MSPTDPTDPTDPTEPRGFAGRRVLVVGASSGIGRGVALAAAALGARVAVVGRRTGLLEKVAAQAPDGVAIAGDVADPQECTRIAARAREELGTIDLVLHTAAVSPLMRLTRTPAEVWHRLMATNAVGPLLVTSALLPALAPGAVVAFTSSRSVGRPYHGVGPYSASKAALDQAVLSLRLEHPEFRFVRVEVGDTAGTDFNREFDVETRRELLPLWQAHGALSAVLLDCDDVSGMIATALGELLARPGITAHDLVFHGAGGILTEPGQRPRVGVGEASRPAAAGPAGQQV